MKSMFLWEENIEIAIWGTGTIGKKLYYKYKNNYNIRCFFDNDANNENTILFGKTVYRYSNKMRMKILIASAWYEDIMKQLDVLGLSIGDDYAPYWLFEYEGIPYFSMTKFWDVKKILELVKMMKKDKELVVLYGNCQTDILRKYLEQNIIFMKTRVFLDIPRICDMSDEHIEHLDKKDFWQECSLFISQYIKDDNRFNSKLATDEIYAKLPLAGKCKRIIITNMFFLGYFPQFKANNHNVLKDMHQGGAFPVGDIFIDKFFFEGEEENEIIDKLSCEDFFNSQEVEKCVEASIKELEMREKVCDVKMADYIRDYYKEEQLFYSRNHPNNFLLKECAVRILRFMGITDNEFRLEKYIEDNYTLKGQDTLIYPSVVKVLGLKKYENYYYPNNSLWPQVLSFEDYIRNYINICLKTT